MKSLKQNKEEGVSPVIATILMVAITVVLAATLYLMVGNMNTGSNSKLLAATLTCSEDFSDAANGNATFIVSMSSPQRASMGDVQIKVLDNNGSLVNSSSLNITVQHLVSDGNHITGGDHILLIYPNHDIHGYQIILYVSGYTGTAEGSVPS